MKKVYFEILFNNYCLKSYKSYSNKLINSWKAEKWTKSKVKEYLFNDIWEYITSNIQIDAEIEGNEVNYTAIIDQLEFNDSAEYENIESIDLIEDLKNYVLESLELKLLL